MDVEREKHYFRVFNWRAIERIKKLISFFNSMIGLDPYRFKNTVNGADWPRKVNISDIQYSY